MGRPTVQIAGKRFGKLTVVSRAVHAREAHWNCVCDCGAETVKSGSKLRRGETKSCSIACGSRIGERNLTSAEISKRFRERHPIRSAKQGRESKKRNAPKHAKKAVVRALRWRKKNRARYLEIHRASGSRRRATKAKSSGVSCTNRIAELLNERFCHWCCAPVDRSTIEIDHVVPLSRGGLHVPENLVASCVGCNRKRGSKLVSEWRWREAA